VPGVFINGLFDFLVHGILLPSLKIDQHHSCIDVNGFFV
jgi:hypothetical protein